MKNFVSGFEILFEYFDPDQLVSGQIPEAWQMFMENSRTIYAQDFATQMKSSNLKTFEIEHKFASKLYPFAGYFGDGASPKDIQQHFFFISNKNDEESFIKTVSSSEYLKKDIKQAAKTVLNPEYTKSLADIVVSGGIKLSFPDEIGKTSEYESISIKRNTNSSSMLKIYFREKE
jgi:hypothetical protein